MLAKPKVFIDGEAGTTGLQVRERLEARDDLEVLSIDADKRKDENERKRLINEADAVILCACALHNQLRPNGLFPFPPSLTNLLHSTGLPDAASEEAASWVEPDNDRTVLIDASTAFRVNDDWVYGFPGTYVRACVRACLFLLRECLRSKILRIINMLREFVLVVSCATRCVGWYLVSLRPLTLVMVL